MLVYIIRRIIWLPFLLFIISFITFTLGTYGPGDPVVVMLGNKYTEEKAQNLRESLGLDRPVLVQYFDYMNGALKGDFGESLRHRGRSVSSLLGSKIWVSFQINISAMIVSLIIGISIGFFIAYKQGSWIDPTIVTIFIVTMSIPVMVTIPYLLRLSCLTLNLIPCSGWGGFWDLRMLLPAFALGIPGSCVFMRLMRSSTLDVLGQDFIRTAHAKGLSDHTINIRHILKNALIPIITLISFSLAGILTTSFIVERILGFPGVGNFLIESIFNRDYPVILAFTLIGSTVFVFANILSDILYAFVAPRIRYS